jgi:hypothetical protein
VLGEFNQKMMLEASTETQESHVFKTNELCVFAGLKDVKINRPKNLS